MPQQIATKVCGITTAAELQWCAAAGVRYVGLNFYQKSPRFVDFEVARELVLNAPLGVAKVGLVVDAEAGFLDRLLETVPLDMIQLHGSETPETVAEVKSRYGLPVMKAVGIRDAQDVPKIETYEAVADQILVDAKPPRQAKLPGGNGLSFDWRLIAGRDWRRPWMLAGGLTPETVATAIATTGANQVDVASGVETSPGHKSEALINAFVAAAV